MATKNALAIVRSVAPRLGIATPNTATGSTDVQVQQLIALVNEEGQELAARYEWQALTHPVTFLASGVQVQGSLTDIIAVNYVQMSFRKIVNDTFWNLTTRTRIRGPLSAPEFNLVTASDIVAGEWSEYRIRGDNLYLYPPPTENDSLRFEFITDSWVTNSTGATLSTGFSADSDVCVLDARLIELGTIWRWKAAKGLDYAQNYQNYENAVMDAMAGDKTGKPVSMDSSADQRGEPYAVIGRSSWPL